MILKNNIEKIHSTKMGIERIKRNLCLDDDVIEYIKNIILTSNNITRKGKNYYVVFDNIRVTINAYSYTIITAHKIRR